MAEITRGVPPILCGGLCGGMGFVPDLLSTDRSLDSKWYILPTDHRIEDPPVPEDDGQDSDDEDAGSAPAGPGLEARSFAALVDGMPPLSLPEAALQQPSHGPTQGPLTAHRGKSALGAVGAVGPMPVPAAGPADVAGSVDAAGFAAVAQAEVLGGSSGPVQGQRVADPAPQASEGVVAGGGAPGAPRCEDCTEDGAMVE